MESEGRIKRRVVFLDIDGVLNNSRWGRRRSSMQSLLDPENIAFMNELVTSPGHEIEVVISSQWRIQMSLEDVVDYLQSDGFEGRIVGATPYIEQGPLDPMMGRGEEIDAWLSDESFVGSFVIVDDRDDMEPHLERLVQTDFEIGFQLGHVQPCLNLLNQPWNRGN